MTRRTEQIASTLQRAVQEVLARGLADPRFGGLVTVTSVRVTPDLKTADVLISVLPEEKQDLTMHAIRHAAGHIRHEVGDLVAMRAVPTLNFRADVSLKKQAEVLRAIARASAESPATDSAAGPDGAPAEGNNPPTPPRARGGPSHEGEDGEEPQP
jgi:ribosome-binding factor A